MSFGPNVVVSRIFSFVQPVPALESLTSFAIVLVDLLTLSLVYWMIVVGRHLIGPGYDLSLYWRLYPCVVLFLVAFFFQGLYPGVLLHPAEEIRRVVFSISGVLLLSATLTFLFRSSELYSRSVFLSTWMLAIPIVILGRRLGRHWLGRAGLWRVSAVILGSGTVARRALEALKDPSSGMRVIGVLTDDTDPEWSPQLPPILGPLSDAPLVAAASIARYAIIALPPKPNFKLRHSIQDYCHGFPHVLLIPDLPGLCSLGLAAREIGGEVGFEMPQRLFHRSSAIMKRTFDLITSILATLILLPFLLLVATLIRLGSKGPIFYSHLRCGRQGRTFKAFKFRSMHQNGDAVLARYLEQHASARELWMQDQKLKDDPRVTRIGKWLRRYSLDELPQLLNVIRGDMSLVGPRPIVSAEITKYGREYNLYTRVPPGLTGLWQVSGRSNTSYEERVAFDEYYVQNWSMWLDAHILVRTARVVLSGEGAY